MHLTRDCLRLLGAADTRESHKHRVPSRVTMSRNPALALPYYRASLIDGSSAFTLLFRSTASLAMWLVWLEREGSAVRRNLGAAF